MSNTTQHTPADVRERVLTVLTAIEWAAKVDHPEGGWYACCPWCGGGDPDDDETPPGHAGHAEWCQLAAVLALLRTPRGEGERGLIMRAMLETFPWSPDIRQEHFERAADAVIAALRSEAPVEGEGRERVAPGWSEVRERANMLRAVLRENGFEHLRSALVGQHSDAVCYGQWERHKALLRDLLDALERRIDESATHPTDRSDSDGE